MAERACQEYGLFKTYTAHTASYRQYIAKKKILKNNNDDDDDDDHADLDSCFILFSTV
jgi:hypothetical protein